MGSSLVKLSVAPRLRPLETRRMLGASAAEYLRSNATLQHRSTEAAHLRTLRSTGAWINIHIGSGLVAQRRQKVPINPRAIRFLSDHRGISMN